MNRMTPTSPETTPDPGSSDPGSWSASWRHHRLLIWALAVSVVLHAMLLLLRVVPPEQWRRILPPEAMELVLVNARTEDAPLHAQVLAQANLDGGGRADVGRATTPLKASHVVRAGDDVEEAEAQVQRLQQEQQLLLSRIKTQLARIDAGQAGADHDGTRATDQRAKRQAMAKLLAQIERRIQEENARPRKRFISASARKSAYALYYDQVRAQVEADGTARFPSANGQRLYGDLTVNFTVNHDGRVLDAEVVIASGQLTLDRATLALVQRQRFAPFDRALRRHVDQLGVVSTFHFMRDNRVRSELVQP